MYVTSLEKYRDLYNINEDIISKQSRQIKDYRLVIENQETIISFNEENNLNLHKINDRLKKELEVSNKKNKKWPYYLGGGFLGGILTCLLIK